MYIHKGIGEGGGGGVVNSPIAMYIRFFIIMFVSHTTSLCCASCYQYVQAVLLDLRIVEALV